MRMPSVNLRTTLLTIFLGGPAFALLAFGPRSQVDVPHDRTVVRYWEKWSGVEAAAMRRIVDRFNATIGAQQGVFVDYASISSIDQRTLIATAGGDPPDIAGLYDYILPQFADRNALTPLDAFANEFNIALDDFNPIWLDICRFDQTLYALPAPPYTTALYYNKTMFRAAGLDPEQPPRTIDELDAYNAALIQRDEAGEITQLGFSPAFLNWWPWIWPKYFGADLWNGRQLSLTGPPVVATLEWLAAQREAVGVKPLLRFENKYAGLIEGVENPFLAGRVAMLHQGPWIANWIQTYRPSLDYGVAPFPSVSENRQYSFASMDIFVIPRGARHPREAMLFLSYLMQQPVLEELCAAHCKPSPFKTPLPGFSEQHPNPYINVFQAAAESPDVFRYPEMPTWPSAADEMVQMMVAILNGAPPKPRATLAEERINARVAEYRARQQARGATP
jgi:ABC-type glycerol-3-phosphate transport system substrate-binding protein